ncbi:MAG TPA: 50S ribosomal protein L9 [Sphingomicrobium sp.]|nr:50S ribosomal protein L9 [Sphingomicrobium sp.]
MEVILLERVEKLGAIGDVVTVKNGFARNYLLPNKKALRANETNRKLFEVNRAKIEADNADKRAEAETASKDVEGKTVQLIRQASNVGHLYGSVSARDIVEALEGKGAKVTKSQIVLDRPIKAIGMHDVKVALHPEVAVTVKVNVARSPEEADLQAQGIDVMAQMFERDAAPPPEELQPEVEGETAEAAAGEEAAAMEAPAETEEPAAMETPTETAESESPAADSDDESPAEEKDEPTA